MTEIRSQGHKTMRTPWKQKIKTLGNALIFACLFMIAWSCIIYLRTSYVSTQVHSIQLDPNEKHLSAIFSTQTGNLMVESYKESTGECIIRSYDHDGQRASEVSRDRTYTMAQCKLTGLKEQ